MSEEDATAALAPLRLDTTLWGDRELVEHIVDRHFTRGGEALVDEMAWDVHPKEKGEAHHSLTVLNSQLASLGWIAVLQAGEPFVLVILPRPPEQTGLRLAQQLGVWAIFATLMSFAGARWIQWQTGPDVLLIDQLEAGFTQFGLPITIVLFIASFARLRLASKHDVELGLHLPIGSPFLIMAGAPVWPFGLLGMFTQRRLDLLAFPNRAVLAAVSLISPLMLMLGGSCLALLGLLYSPTNPAVGIELAPVLLNPSPLVRMVAEFWLSESEVLVRSSLLHPLGLAGAALSVMGWILLLPLPGLPGNRLMVAMLGPDQFLSGNAQTAFFGSLLVLLIGVMLVGGYWPWVLLILVALMRRFNTDVTQLPLIIDEAKAFTEQERNPVGMIWVAALLLCFPGVVPVMAVDDWQDGVDLSDWPDAYGVSAGEAVTLELDVVSEGLVMRDVAISAGLFGAHSDWLFSLDCGAGIVLDLDLGCTVEGVSNLTSGQLTVEVHVPGAADLAGPVDLTLHLDDGNEVLNHTIRLTPDHRPGPLSPGWSTEGETLCLGVENGELPGNLSVLDPLWSGIELALTANQEEELCLTPREGAFAAANASGGLAPEVTLRMDDGMVYRWALPIHFNESTEGPFAAHLERDLLGEVSIELNASDGENHTFVTRWHGDVEPSGLWTHNLPSGLAANETANLTVTGHGGEDVMQVAWLAGLGENAWALHMATWCVNNCTEAA